MRFFSSIKHFLSRHQAWFFPLILVLITIIISYLNYSPNTWLAGWDTLLPELNLPEHFSRSFSGAWRQDQGLGAVAAHSHMAELPRLILLAFLNLFLPSSFLRYIIIFLCFILGPLGIYFFVRQAIFTPIQRRDNPFRVSLTAFMAAIFYLFNLGTIQHFFVVFEMFAFQYAALGWLFLLATFALKPPQKAHRPFYLFLFFVVSFFASAMAYASQLWFAYLLSLILYLAVLFFSDLKKARSHFIQILLLLLLTLAANAYWLFPNLYFLFSSASAVPASSQINQAFSAESFLSNAAYSSFSDTVIYKNFLFNWEKFNFTTQQFGQILQTWHDHLSNPFNQIWPFLVFAFTLLGLVVTFVRRQKSLYALIPIALLALFIIMNTNPLFNWAFSFFRDNFSIFREGLRTPWTKFSLLLMFTFSCFAAYGFYFLTGLIKKKILITLCACFLFAGSIYFCWPMFRGYLISPEIKVALPKTYLDFWAWSQQQPDSARMALLPAPTYTAWEYYDWGYEGAGFLWFGMPQPLFTRDFDRWNPHNETFYRELSRAIYDFNPTLLDEILRRYQVSYLVLDESYFLPGEDNQDRLFIPELKAYFAENQYPLVWQSEWVSVYQVAAVQPTWVSTAVSSSAVLTTNLYVNYNVAAAHHSSFFEPASTSGLSPIIYPFAELYQDQLSNVQFTETEITKTSSLFNSASDQNYDLILPPLLTSSNSAQKYTLPVKISYDAVAAQVTFSFSSPSLSWQDPIGQLQTASWPQLADQVFSLATPSGDLVVQLGDQQIYLAEQQTKLTSLEFQPDQTLVPVILIPQSEIVFSQGTPTVDSSQIISQDLILTDQITAFFTPQTIKLDYLPNSLTVHWPQLLSDRVDLQNSDNLNNCGRVSIGTQERIQSLSTSGGTSVLYKSTDQGALCDSAILTNTTNQNDYLLSISAENTSGRPLKFILFNLDTNKPDLQKILPPSAAPAVYNIPGWSHQSPAIYRLNWENRSFGLLPSINRLSAINTYQIDLRTIAQIQLVPSNAQPVSFGQLEFSHLRKIGTHRYEITVQNHDSEPGLLILNASFESGWQALSQDGQSLEHIIVDGWKNGWLIPPNREGEPHKIVIEFWPQITSTVGFYFLAGTFLTLGSYNLVRFLVLAIKKRR